MLSTALEPEELITAVVVNKLGTGEGAAYVKFPHPASRYAIVGAAAYVKLDGGSLSACRVAVTGAGPKAVRLTNVEQAVLGGASLEDATRDAGTGMDILGDIHASEEYRRAMVGVYARRALTKAMERARG
jgi:aerobic carbon-monoxide dehydrogenase medium subunit